MLKTRYIDNDINVNTLISAQDYSSDRDQYNNKLLNLGTLSVINAINDSEVFEFKPNTQKLNFNIFFLRYLQDRDITEISPYMESQFSDHIKKTKIALGIINDYGYDSDRAFSHIFEMISPLFTKISIMPKLPLEKHRAIVFISVPEGLVSPDG